MLVITGITYLYIKQQTESGMYPGGGRCQAAAPKTYKFKLKKKKKQQIL